MLRRELGRELRHGAKPNSVALGGVSRSVDDVAFGVREHQCGKRRLQRIRSANLRLQCFERHELRAQLAPHRLFEDCSRFELRQRVRAAELENRRLRRLIPLRRRDTESRALERRDVTFAVPGP